MKKLNKNYFIKKFCNVLIKKGKKELALKIVNKILSYIFRVTKRNPLLIFLKAIKKGRPLLWYNINNLKVATVLILDVIKPEVLAKLDVKVYLIKKYDTSIFYFFSWLVKGLAKLDKESDVVIRIGNELIKLAKNSPDSYILRHKKRMRSFLVKGKNNLKSKLVKKNTYKPNFYALRKNYVFKCIYKKQFRLYIHLHILWERYKKLWLRFKLIKNLKNKSWPFKFTNKDYKLGCLFKVSARFVSLYITNRRWQGFIKKYFRFFKRKKMYANLSIFLWRYKKIKTFR